MTPPAHRLAAGFTRLVSLLFVFLAALFAAPAHAADVRTLLTPVSVTATGGGADLDIASLRGRAHVTLTSLNTAGTSPTLATKLQESAPLTVGASYTTTGTNDLVLRNNTNDNISLAAKWTQSGAGQIKRVGLKLKKNGTITSGKILTLTINTNSTADPSATILGTAETVQTDNIGTSYDWVVFTFAKPVDVSDATVYWLVLTGDYTLSSSNNVTWRVATVASGGNFNIYDSAWAAVSTQSAEFYAHQYVFSDVTGGGFTTLSTAGNTTVQTLEFNIDDLKPIVRAYFTVGGTSNPAFATALTVHGN